MTAPVGAIVSLHVDLLARVGSGDVIQTQTGRRYRVIGVREQTRGKHTGRQHLRCVVVDRDVKPDNMVYAGRLGITRPGAVHTIRWYVRGKKS